MICVSFGNISFDKLNSKLSKYELAEIRFDLVELSLNQISTLFTLNKNIIAAFRFSKKPNKEELIKIETAVKSGATFVDLDISCDKELITSTKQLCQLYNCKLILSYHNYSCTPKINDLQVIVEEMFFFKADIVKIACTAISYNDLAILLSLYQDVRPIIALSMGDIGKISRLLAIELGAPFTYAYDDTETPTALSQYSFNETLEGLALLENPQNKYFAVCGKPISHSLSPILFKAHSKNQKFFYKRALCLSYKDVEVLLQNGFDGCNITAPFKTDVLNLNYNFSNSVKAIGSANTIYKSKKDIFAENTDVFSVFETLKNEIKNLGNKNILILGSGGAAKAAIFALINKVASITIANRTIFNAKQLAEKFNAKYITYSSLIDELHRFDILINTLPYNADYSFTEKLTSKHVVFDADYKFQPLKNISEIKQAKYISGINWLVNQAITAFELFTNIKPKEKVLFNSIKNYKPNINNSCIVIVGMMKSGKTTVGKLLAEKLNYQFFDTDLEIERTCKMSVSEIFKTKGEEFFRQNEKKVLKKLINKSNVVISAGGGLVCDIDNRKILKTKANVVWLFASPKELASREDKENIRPKLLHGNQEMIFSKLLKIRFKFYSEIANFLVVVDNHTVNQITDAIYEEVY